MTQPLSLDEILDPDRFAPARLATWPTEALTAQLDRHRSRRKHLMPVWNNLLSRHDEEAAALEAELARRTA